MLSCNLNSRPISEVLDQIEFFLFGLKFKPHSRMFFFKSCHISQLHNFNEISMKIPGVYGLGPGQGSRLLYSFSLNQVWGRPPQKWLGMK